MNTSVYEIYLNVLLTIDLVICIKSSVNLFRNETGEVAVSAVKTYQVAKKNQNNRNPKRLNFIVFFDILLIWFIQNSVRLAQNLPI